MRLSVVVPCYNEAKNIKSLISKCSKLLDTKEIELIFVNNGSTDNTSKILKKELVSNRNAIIKTVKINEGYGHGILCGLKSAKGEILAWTHADLQTDPNDLLKAFDFYKNFPKREMLFVKGNRKGRSFKEVFFTWGMSFIGLFFFQKQMSDINAQPTMFHRSFFEKWYKPPKDFSLDLYVYHLALKNKLTIKRFLVYFDTRKHGVGHNEKLISKIRYSFTTIRYMAILRLSDLFKSK